ncbi:hypothetical protein Tco_1266672 [Tanacetum coccineum]
MCMFALTVSTAEPKNFKEATADSAWIEAIQDELHQFNKLQVWELVDKPSGKTIIKLKWLWKNKKDEYQTKGEVYVAQPDGFIDLDHPEKVDCLRKALYRLKLQIHQSPRGIFINQAKYALEILKKHGMEICESLGTPLATKSKSDAHLSGTPIDLTKYRSMIGSLMYQTSSRPSKTNRKALQRDADHVGCLYTRKSASRGIKFLGDKLVSWMSKKQDCIAMSSAKAEYVALSASFSHSNLMQPRATLPYQAHQQVERGIIELYFVRTEYQLPDMFTKALPEYRFQYLVRQICMICLTPAELEVLANESA